MIVLNRILPARFIKSETLYVPQAAGGTSCPLTSAPDVSVPGTFDDGNQIAQNTDKFYLGQHNYVDASTRVICWVGVYWGVGAGTPSLVTNTVKIWTYTGTTLNSAIGTTNSLAGPSSNGWAYFDFASHPTMTGGTAHAITIECDAGVTANKAQVSSDTPSSVAGNMAWWNSVKGLDTSLTTYDFSFQLGWDD